MALRNRKDTDESKLRGVEIAGDANEVEFGKFTSLQNWIPAQVYSIKKKRGVEAFESDPLSPDPLTSNCGLCPSDTIPDPQSLDWEQCYEIGPSGGISSNNRGQFNPIPAPAPNVNAIVFYGTADASDIPWPPASNEAAVILVTDDGTETTETPVDIPAGDAMDLIRTTARIGIAGHTDVLGYVIQGADYTPSGQASLGDVVIFFNWDEQSATVMDIPHGESYSGKWCKLGNDFYKIGGTGGTRTDLAYWDMSAGQYSTPTASRADVAGASVDLRDVYRTANKLWVVAESGDLIELNPTTLATVNTYATGISAPDDIIGLHAASDTLFYICHEASASSDTTIYMFHLPGETLEALNTEDINSLGCQINVSSGEPDGHTFHFAGGYFYFHSAGTTGDAKAGRLGPVFCPGTDDTIIGGDGES